MARPQSVGGGRPIRVSTALSRAEKADFDRIRRGMKPADYLRVLINREAARQSPWPDQDYITGDPGQGTQPGRYED